MTLKAFLLVGYSNQDVREKLQEMLFPPLHIKKEYDFIIVGAGPAGCVLANRLTERPDWRVLLIEAGDVENEFHELPILAPFLQGTAANWNYLTEPQELACFGMNERRCAFPRGKALGGSSVINYMIYNRGNPRDFDRWSEAGNTGWSYKEILPYFKKSEHANLKGKEKSKYHGRKGPLSVEDVPFRSEVAKSFVKGCQQYGFPEVDYNGETQMGVSFFQATTLNGRRHSAATAFIKPILGRPNLDVMLNTRATKVLIDEQTKTAFGVQYAYRKKYHSVKAKKEVILSSGTFNSPQLLMLSGIGPKDHLDPLGIQIIKDLPVGKIMYDHMAHQGPTFVLNSTGNRLNMEDPTLFERFLKGDSIFTTIGGVEALVFAKTPNSTEPADFPDVELIFGLGSLATDKGTAIKMGTNLREDIYEIYKPLESIEEDLFTVIVMGFHPQSVGNLKLKDKNPFHWPLLHPNYFENEEDIETLLQGIKLAIEISKTPALQKIGAKIYDVPLPNCKHLPFGSDDYWRCSIRTLSFTLHHQVGTCKMGPSTDSTSVVNSQLQVHGIHRLRVVDTSIIPMPPTSHTNAASFMIGEKAADMIKQFWHESG